MDYYEDGDYTTTAVEQRLLDGLTATRLAKLTEKLLEVMLTEYHPTAPPRRLVQLATELETGALFDGFFSETYRGVRFRSKRRMLDIDKEMQPYYGYMNGALSELRAKGIDPAICDAWLANFRSDNGHYRVASVAGMCVACALADLGYILTV